MAREYTRRERFQNWFYYNKLWVAVGAIILWVAGSMLWNVLGIGQVKPDYYFAYVGPVALPEDCVDALEAELAALAPDANGDGRVSVRLTQYVQPDSGSPEDLRHSYAAQMALLADITEGQSVFFLLADPQDFQSGFQILAHPDGSVPAEDDFRAMDKVFRWSDCPALCALELGSYTDSYLDITETGENQSLLSGLFLGRRYFYDKSQEKHPAENAALWQSMIAEAAG